MAEDLSENVRESLKDCINAFVVNGARASEVLDAVVAQAAVLRQAYDRDPDPADGAGSNDIAEPSNDWPAADGEKSQPGGTPE